MVMEVGVNWMGCRYRCPMIWSPLSHYQSYYELSTQCDYLAFQEIKTRVGFKRRGEETYEAYSLTTLLINYLFS